jgi:predicted DNA-binding ribbon-helix-helix protein
MMPDTEDDPARLEKHSLYVAGHSTSVTLEAIFWRYLKDMANREGRSINDIVTEIDARRSGNLSSALRVEMMRKLLERGSKPASGA